MVYSGWRLTARQEFERYVSVLNQVKINRKILTDVHSVTQSVTAKFFFFSLKNNIPHGGKQPQYPIP